MKWFQRFGLPGKFTLIFSLAMYIPLLLAGIFAFNLTQDTEKKFGLKVFGRLSDRDFENLKNQFDRLKSEIIILSKNNQIQELLNIHDNHPTLGPEKLMRLEKYSNIVKQLEERFRLIMSSNKNLYGIGLYIGKENVLAINEDKITHKVTSKSNVPIPAELVGEYEGILKSYSEGIYHRDAIFLSPFERKSGDVLDSDIVYRGESNSLNKIPFFITFYNNPFVNINKFLIKDLTNPSHSFTVILKDTRDGKVEDYSKSDNSPLIQKLIKKLPETFLKRDSGEFIERNGNIYTIRKISMALKNLDKISIISFYPAKLIRQPFEDIRNLFLKIFAICSLFSLLLLFFILRFLIGDLRGVTWNLKKTSDTLEKSTKEIQEASAIIKKSNKDNNTRVSEINNSMEEMSTLDENFQREFLEMNNLSKKTSTSAMEGRNDLNDLAVSMEQIIESSRNIFKIINIIENISMQTDILSMNASVEAARAGEHGKGFAVVAGAIRNLAQQSSKSATEIGKQIQESIEITEKGAEKAAQNRSKFKDIIENIEKLNNSIDRSSQTLSIRLEAIAKLGAELKKINIAVNEASQQTEKNEDVAVRLLNEVNSLHESIEKIMYLIEGVKKLTNQTKKM